MRSNLLGEFGDEASALAAVRQMMDEEPDVTEDIGLLAVDDAGDPASVPALTGDSLRAAVEDRREGPRAA